MAPQATPPEVAVSVLPHPRARREDVLEALRALAHPADAAEVARQLGLHTNTVRGHLELLVHLGQATRAIERRERRGRPRVLYAPSAMPPASVEAFRTLANVLALELAAVAKGDPSGVQTASREWAESMVRAGRLSPMGDREASVREVSALFADLGFDVTTEPLGDRLYLRRCPFVDQISDLPAICDLHHALLGAAFAATGGHVDVPVLDVLPRPDLCVATLRDAGQTALPLEPLPALSLEGHA